MPRDPALLGKRFEVMITSTGKHFLKGQVVKESLVQAMPRPPPLPAGHVSGHVTPRPQLGQASGTQTHKMSGRLGQGVGLDVWILIVTAVAIALALLFRMLE